MGARMSMLTQGLTQGLTQPSKVLTLKNLLLSSLPTLDPS